MAKNLLRDDSANTKALQKVVGGDTSADHNDTTGILSKLENTSAPESPEPGQKEGSKKSNSIIVYADEKKDLN